MRNILEQEQRRYNRNTIFSIIYLILYILITIITLFYTTPNWVHIIWHSISATVLLSAFYTSRKVLKYLIQFAEIIDESPICLGVTDKETGIMLVTSRSSNELLDIHTGDSTIEGFNSIEDRNKMLESVDNNDYIVCPVEFKNRHYLSTITSIVLDKKPALLSVAIETTDLVNTRKRLEKQNRYLKEYAHIISHDLKSPINAAGKFTGKVKRIATKKEDKVILKMVGYVEDSIKKAKRMLDRLSTIESIGKSARKKPISLTNLLKELKDQFKGVNPNLVITLPDDDYIIYAEEDSLYRILQNIIANGIKYNDKKVKNIAISVDNTYIHIKDNGIGLTSEESANIFNIFTRLQPEEDGSGVGLTIVQRYIDAHDWSLSLESKKGIGSTFTIDTKKDLKNE